MKREIKAQDKNRNLFLMIGLIIVLIALARAFYAVGENDSSGSMLSLIAFTIGVIINANLAYKEIKTPQSNKSWVALTCFIFFSVLSLYLVVDELYDLIT